MHLHWVLRPSLPSARCGPYANLLTSSHLMRRLGAARMAENHHLWCIVAESTCPPLTWLCNPAGEQAPARTANACSVMGHYREPFLARAGVPGS